MDKLLTKSGLFGASLILATATGTSQAALDIAQGPLYLSVSAEPNVLFVLDDSGSMHWELMPDEYVDVAYYMFPRVNDMYSNDDYRNFVPVFDDAKGFSVAMRSPDVNKIFYNPEITYSPWMKYDGTQYPNAVPAGAYYNPEKTGVGSFDLTASQSKSAYWRSCDGPNNSDCDKTDKWGGGDPDNDVTETSKTFYPAVYYRYDGDGDIWDPANYVKVTIESATDTYSDDSGLTTRAGRTDCISGSCSYTQEMQNFANWFTYYRSRVLLARAGVGNAFAQQGGNLRVGFGAFNVDNTNVDGTVTDTLKLGVRKFYNADTDDDGTDEITYRSDFFDELYGHPIPTSGTPLRTSLQDAGDYFSRPEDSQSPWDSTPEDNNDDIEELACRQSYTIIMSDGYWNGDDPGVGDVDGTEDSSIDPEGYESTSTVNPFDHPYMDTNSDTMADVAMNYWYQDLRTDLDNKVPTNSQDAAYWQHMVTFTVGLGVFGDLDPVADWDDLVAGNISWPAPCDGCQEENIDDMFHAAVNGRGGFFSASNPNEFATALNDSLVNIVSRNSSASAVATNSTRISSDTLIYQGRFNSGNWNGQLYAFPIDSDGSVEDQEWEASAIMDATGEGAVGSRVRNIVTFNGTSGVDFEYDNLSDDQKLALDKDRIGTTDNLGYERVDFLRGIRTYEGNPFRVRSSLLGDIVNSDPFYVQDANYGYQNLDLNGNEGDDYRAFREDSDYKNRPPVLYVGANDGMLHAFNADSEYDTSAGTGDLDAGKEMFAFVPAAIYDNLTDLTSSDYDHRFYVDGSPKAGDAYLPTTASSCPLTGLAPSDGYCWNTVLLGSTGAGGKSVFALNVTDPDNFSADDVMWELTHAELGYTMGQPTIVRLDAAPYWFAIFGNGYNSTSQRAQLFIVELATGDIAAVIDTEVGSTAVGDENGLATPLPVDLNNDRITDVIYAGDLHGNMWKFDVDGNKNGWDVAYSQGNTPKPLFQACTASTCTAAERQPITVKPSVGGFKAEINEYDNQGNVTSVTTSTEGVMVYFGTGKYFESDDALDVGADSQIQSFYGIRDNGSDLGSDRSTLQEQTIEYEQYIAATDLDVRVTSESTVNYASQNGWFMDLCYDEDGDGSCSGVEKEGERSISPSILRRDRIIFTTAIPSADPCDWGGDSWLMELDAINGAVLSYAVIDITGDGKIDEADMVLIDGEKRFISGKRLDGIGEPGAIITAGDKEYKYISTSSGAINVTQEEGGGEAFARQSWIQMQ